MMNNNLKNLKVEPDDKVWQRISATLHRKVIIQRTLWTVAAVALIATMVVAFLPKSHPSETIASVPINTVQPISQEALSQPISSEATPSAEPIADEVIVSDVQPQAMQLEIATELVMVEENEPAIATEVPAPEHKTEATNLAIVGGADGPTSMFVASEQPTVVSPSTASPQPIADSQFQVETSIATVSDEVETPREDQPASVIIPETGNSPIPAELILWVPNVIIPHGDIEENRVFRVRSNAPLSEYRIQIYDRSGRRVFQSQDISQVWDGTRNGASLPQAAYVYVIQYKDRNGKPFVKKGTVTLVK